MVINVDNNKLHYLHLTPHTQTHSEVEHVKLLGQRELLRTKAAVHYQLTTYGKSDQESHAPEYLISQI